MPRRFNSYLIRWWRGDSERLEIEHIQSGRKRLATSAEDALAWLTAQQNTDEDPGEPGMLAEPHDQPVDEGDASLIEQELDERNDL